MKGRNLKGMIRFAKIFMSKTGRGFTKLKRKGLEYLFFKTPIPGLGLGTLLGIVGVQQYPMRSACILKPWTIEAGLKAIVATASCFAEHSCL